MNPPDSEESERRIRMFRRRVSGVVGKSQNVEKRFIGISAETCRAVVHYIDKLESEVRRLERERTA